MHSDGLFYDLSTPEAFDEVFFLSFNTNEEIQENLIDYISLGDKNGFICYFYSQFTPLIYTN